MSKPRKIKLLTRTAALALTASAAAIATTPSLAANAPAAHATRQYYSFHGTVTSSSRGHWFQMHTTTNRSLRIYANGHTRWDDCDWGEMNRGHHVEVSAYRSQGRWVASRMQNWNDWDNGRRDHGNKGNGNHGDGDGNWGNGNMGNRNMR